MPAVGALHAGGATSMRPKSRAQTRRPACYWVRAWIAASESSEGRQRRLQPDHHASVRPCGACHDVDSLSANLGRPYTACTQSCGSCCGQVKRKLISGFKQFLLNEGLICY